MSELAFAATLIFSRLPGFPGDGQGSFSAEDFLQHSDMLTGMAIIAAVRHKKAIEPNHGYPYG